MSAETSDDLLRTCRSCDKITATDPCNWCGKASIQPSDEPCATPECGHIERWHKHGRCAGDMLSCACRSFVAPSSPVSEPAERPDPVMDRVRRARGGRGEIDAPPGKFESAAKGLPWPPAAAPAGREFAPDWSLPPGDIITAEMQARGTSIDDMLDGAPVQAQQLADILAGRTAVTREFASHLARIWGVPAVFWLRLETNWQEYRQQSTADGPGDSTDVGTLGVPEAVYLNAARSGNAAGPPPPDIDPEQAAHYATKQPAFRAAIEYAWTNAREEGIRIGREAAAQAIHDHADRIAPKDDPAKSTMRRHLLIGVQVAANPATREQIAAAIKSLARPSVPVVCHLDEAGRSVVTDGA